MTILHYFLGFPPIRSGGLTRYAIDLMKEQTGEYPLLLLDDVLSELDTIRQTHLLTAIQNKVQTFLTTTSLSDVARQLINEPTIFEIEHGTLNKEEVK